MLKGAYNQEHTMPRPIKQRLVDGVVLSDNLYSDPRGRPGYYRYKRPDGSFKTFQAPTPEDANRQADEANAVRDMQPIATPSSRDSLAYQIPLYIQYREKQERRLVGKRSWENRCYALHQFAKEMAIPVNRLSWPLIKTWWEGLTYHQQKLRCAEFRRLFNWLMGEGLCRLEYNPFTSNDELPRLYPVGRDDKARQRLRLDEFWVIYNAAERYPALRIAMGISLVTFMRENDICTLRWDEHVDSGMLRRVIGKSEQALGSARAARRSWDIANHALLKTLLKDARELAMRNFRCPFVISHKFRRRRSDTKEHRCQVTRWRLAEMFAEIRDETGLWENLPDGQTPPTFHEIRSLASKLARDAGYDIEAIQADMAHEDAATTKGYQEGHALPFEPARVVFSKEVIGGEF